MRSITPAQRSGRSLSAGLLAGALVLASAGTALLPQRAAASPPPVLTIGGVVYEDGDAVELSVGDTVVLEFTWTFPANDGFIIYQAAFTEAALDCTTLEKDGVPIVPTGSLPFECAYRTSIPADVETKLSVEMTVTDDFDMARPILLRYYAPSAQIFTGAGSWPFSAPSASSTVPEPQDPVEEPAEVPTQAPAAGAVAASSALDGAVRSAVGAVAGSSGVFGVLVRGGSIVPLEASLAGAVGPNGGVVLATEGLRVAVAAAGGASSQAGVIVPPNGEIVCELCAPLLPGSTVEAWLSTDPRLAAAVRVPSDHAAGDCVVLAVPVGAPLDGQGPIGAGAHTLQVRMDTVDGPEVLATGVTIGAAVPQRIPAGEGSRAPQLLVLLAMVGIIAIGVAPRVAVAPRTHG